MKKRFFNSFINICAGSVLYAVGIYSFLTPSNIAPGGISGISIMLNYLFGLPIGTTSLVINIPVFIIGYYNLNRKIILKSIPALFLSSFILDFVAINFFPVYHGERLLGSIFGGIVMGAGLGLIFLNGCTTGGTDVLSLLLKKKHPHLRMGIAMLIIDCIILSASILVFNDIESGMYGIITLFCSTKLVDYIIYSGDAATLTFIISDKYKAIADKILTELDRGTTILNARGGYTGKNVTILMCAVRRQEFPILKELIFSVDNNAFLTSSASEGIFGEGFSQKNALL